MFRSIGKFNYYNTWLLVDCCLEIPRFYRTLIHFHSRSIFLNSPLHESHITIIAGKYENVSNRNLWKKYDGNEVEFEYSNEIGTDGTYFWLPVFSPMFEKVRMELGISPTTPIPWHLTVGNTKKLNKVVDISESSDTVLSPLREPLTGSKPKQG